MKNLFKARWMTSLIFLIALFVITGIAAPGFLTYDNIVTCFNTATMYTLLAVGIAFVIMTGEIDVSIGATLGLTAGMTGLIAQQDGSILKMLLLCLATGAAIGLVNGIGVSYFGVPSLIFTLGTNSVVRGLIYIMSGGRTIENFGGAISSYGNKTVFAGVTLYYAIAVVLVAISHLALTKTRKGKYFIAVGDNAGGATAMRALWLQGALGPGARLASAGKRRAEAILVVDVHVLEIAQDAAEPAGNGAHARESEVLVQVDGGFVRGHHGVELHDLKLATLGLGQAVGDELFADVLPTAVGV